MSEKLRETHFEDFNLMQIASITTSCQPKLSTLWSSYQTLGDDQTLPQAMASVEPGRNCQFLEAF